MTYGEFKNLGYVDDLPMEYALVQALLDGKINILEVNNAYSMALERERHIRKMRFEESCINLSQLLCGNYGGNDLKKAQQRAIHTLNMAETLPHNLYNDKYDYTEEIKAEFDKLCKNIYGVELDYKESKK